MPLSKSTTKIALQQLQPTKIVNKSIKVTAGGMSKSKTSSGIRVEMENTLVQLCDMWFYEIKPALVRDNVKIRCDERNGNAYTKATPASCQPHRVTGMPHPGGDRAKNLCGDADPLDQLGNLLDCASKMNVAASPAPVRAAAAHPRVQNTTAQQNRTKTHNAKTTNKGKIKLSLVKQCSTSKCFPKTFGRRSTVQDRLQSRVRRLERKEPPLEKEHPAVNKANFHRKQNYLFKQSVKLGRLDISTVRAYLPNFDQKLPKKTKTCRVKKNGTFK